MNSRAPAVLPLLFLLACGRHADSRGPAEKKAAPIDASLAHEEVLPVKYHASGTVRGRNTATLTSKTLGYVRAIRVRPGDRVTAGQPLVELEANDLRASVARAKASLGQSVESKLEAENALVAAKASSKIAKTSFDRAAQLLKDNAIAPQQFDEAEARWSAAQAQERMAEARVRAVGANIDEAKAALGEVSATLGYSVIAAPFAGRVLERRVDPGVLAVPGTPLLVVADEGALRVEASVEESRADAIKLGDIATIAIESLSQPLVGKVGEIVPNVDTGSRSLMVKIDLPGEAGTLRPGTYAHVSFVIGAQSRLVVPTKAVSSFGAIDRVFVVEGDRAHLRVITRGEGDDAWTEILSGLSQGERIAVGNIGALRDGVTVEVRP